MLIRIKGLHGTILHAQDGDIGSIDEVLFDDEQWTVRYLVADTGGWLLRRKVLIAPVALGALDWDGRRLDVNLTRDQVERSPGVETNAPVSRQWEKDYYDYYAWPYYWGNMGMSGGMSVSGGIWNPGALLASEEDETHRTQDAEDERARGHESPRDRGDSHLRSTKEVTGYGIVARDGHLGHVEDFLVDAQTWRICYLAVDTRDWWPGKHVLVPSEWIGQVLWPDRTVRVEMTRHQVSSSPEWDSRKPISRTVEDALSTYYVGLHLGKPNGQDELPKPSRPPQERNIEKQRTEPKDMAAARAEADAQMTEAVKAQEGPNLGDIGSLED